MKDQIIKISVTVIFMFCVLYTAGTIGYINGYDKASIEPLANHFWIDNNRLAIDSETYPTPLYDIHGAIVGVNVKVVTSKGDSYIEFLDSENMTWEEDYDSFIMAWRERDLK